MTIKNYIENLKKVLKVLKSKDTSIKAIVFKDYTYGYRIVNPNFDIYAFGLCEILLDLTIHGVIDEGTEEKFKGDLLIKNGGQDFLFPRDENTLVNRIKYLEELVEVLSKNMN